MRLDDLVAQYIKGRDLKAKIKADYDAKVARIDAVLDKAEAVLLAAFREAGVESIKTPFGTAYTTHRTSATIADWDSFLAFVREKEAYEMLERRCAKAAVEQFKAANDDLPPGVNWRSEQVVNIRRS